MRPAKLSLLPAPLKKDLKENYGGNIEAAKAVGKAIAEKALAKGVKEVVFDRGGYLYHGRVAALLKLLAKLAWYSKRRRK